MKELDSAPHDQNQGPELPKAYAGENMVLRQQENHPQCNQNNRTDEGASRSAAKDRSHRLPFPCSPVVEQDSVKAGRDQAQRPNDLQNLANDGDIQILQQSEDPDQNNQSAG